MPIRRPVVFIVVALAVVAGILIWFTGRLNTQEMPTEPQSAASQETMFERKSLEAIAVRLGGAELYDALRTQEAAIVTSEAYIVPRSIIIILKADGKGGVLEQQLPVMPDSGYRVVEIRAGKLKVWRVLPYDGYMRADPDIEVLRR